MNDLSQKQPSGPVVFLKATILSVVLPVVVIAIWAKCANWDSAYDDLPLTQKEHIESCAVAHRELGPAVYKKRLDCLDVLPKRTSTTSAAKTSETP